MAPGRASSIVIRRRADAGWRARRPGPCRGCRGPRCAGTARPGRQQAGSGPAPGRRPTAPAPSSVVAGASGSPPRRRARITALSTRLATARCSRERTPSTETGSPSATMRHVALLGQGLIEFDRRGSPERPAARSRTARPRRRAGPWPRSWPGSAGAGRARRLAQPGRALVRRRRSSISRSSRAEARARGVRKSCASWSAESRSQLSSSSSRSSVRFTWLVSSVSSGATAVSGARREKSPTAARSSARLTSAMALVRRRRAKVAAVRPDARIRTPGQRPRPARPSPRPRPSGRRPARR